MIFSTDEEEVFDKIQHISMIKVLENMDIKDITKYKKVIVSNPIANIKLDGDKLKAFL